MRLIDKDWARQVFYTFIAFCSLCGLQAIAHYFISNRGKEPVDNGEQLSLANQHFKLLTLESPPKLYLPTAQQKFFLFPGLRSWRYPPVEEAPRTPARLYLQAASAASWKKLCSAAFEAQYII